MFTENEKQFVTGLWFMKLTYMVIARYGKWKLQYHFVFY